MKRIDKGNPNQLKPKCLLIRLYQFKGGQSCRIRKQLQTKSNKQA